MTINQKAIMVMKKLELDISNTFLVKHIEKLVKKEPSILDYL